MTKEPKYQTSQKKRRALKSREISLLQNSETEKTSVKLDSKWRYGKDWPVVCRNILQCFLIIKTM